MEPKLGMTLLNSVAIVGIGCRLPGSNSLEEFWKLLHEGRDGIRTMPEDRWTTENRDDAEGTKAGFLSCEIDKFDGKFFGISASELEYVDPQHRLLLQV